METVTTAAVSVPKKKKKINMGRISLFAMALPLFILMFAFQYVPLFGWMYALFDYRPGIPLSDTEFVGMKFFKWVVEDWDIVSKVLVNTLAMSLLSILGSPLAVVFAILLNEIRSRKFQKIVQTMTTLPYFISMVIVFSLATFMFSSSGLLNQVMTDWGWIDKPTNVLANPSAVWWFQTGVGIWKGLGFGAIIYLAAIAGIDQELYDAAEVDGAGRFGRIMHITVPGILPTFFVLLLLNIAGMLSHGFEQHFVFYNALVADKIETLDYYVYRMGIGTGEISYGTAIGILKSVVSIVLLFTMNTLSRKIRGEAVF